MDNQENIDLMDNQENIDFREMQYNCTRPESWVWSEEQVSWIAPVPVPLDGLPYVWDEEVKNWVLFPNWIIDSTNEGQ